MIHDVGLHTTEDDLQTTKDDIDMLEDCFIYQGQSESI